MTRKIADVIISGQVGVDSHVLTIFAMGGVNIKLEDLTRGDLEELKSSIDAALAPHPPKFECGCGQRDCPTCWPGRTS